MRISSLIAALAIGLAVATPLQAHRTEGLLQSSLVEIFPTQVGVEVTLVPGMDIAPKIVALLDRDHDGVFSEIESNSWSELFMAKQSVTVDGQTLPIKLQSIRASSLNEMGSGHAEISAYFTANLGELGGPRTIVCANHYEPIPSTYQCNGLVPKFPGVRITSHRRDGRQQELILAAEFFDSTASAKHAANPIPQTRLPSALWWFVGLSLGVISLIAAYQWSFANAAKRRTR